MFGTSSLDPEFAGGGGADITVPCLGFFEALSKGVYNFDPGTPAEHLYTDIGWYGLVTLGEIP